MIKRSKCSFFAKDKKRTAQKTCDAMLFNDLLLVAEESAGQGKVTTAYFYTRNCSALFFVLCRKAAGQVKLQVHVLLELESVASIRSTKEDVTQSFKDLEQSQIEMAGTAICLIGKKDRKVGILGLHSFSFHVKVTKDLFFLNSNSEKEEWLNALNEILNKLKTEKRMKGLN